MTRTPANHVEVYGKSVQALVNAMDILKFRAHRTLAAHGIHPLETEKWYSMRAVLDSFDDILKQVGPYTTRAIGQAIPRNAVFPPGIDTLEAAWMSLDQAYRMNHRGAGDIGSYRYESLGDNTGRMVCDNPYPCEFDQGIIEALYDRFLPKGSFRLRIDHDSSGCRAKGHLACTYHLKW